MNKSESNQSVNLEIENRVQFNLFGSHSSQPHDWVILTSFLMSALLFPLNAIAASSSSIVPTQDIDLSPQVEQLVESVLADNSADHYRASDNHANIDELTAPTFNQQRELDWANLDPDPAINQLTSVFQLSDVQAEDWAFQALQSLVERYGCIVGYPDGTYRGTRSLTRYEFAAGLNACLDRITELIEQSSADLIRQEDLATLQRLQNEFAAELTALTGQVDALEARSAELEANQFSTTTILTGQIWFNLTGATADDDVKVETNNLDTPLNLRPAARDSQTGEPIISEVRDDPSITLSYYAWLNLNTSFTGRDSLVTQLAVGNAISPANTFISAGLFNTFGVPFTDQTGTPTADDFVVRELFYDFPVGDALQVAVGPRINWYRYFDTNAYTFFVSGAGSYNSSGGTLVNAIDRGSGAVVRWDINDQFDLAIGYLGENTEFLPGEFFNTASNPDKGLFEGTNTLSVGLTYSPSSRANIRLLYNRSILDTNVAIRNEAGEVTGSGVGGATGEPIYGVADDGFGGSIEDAEAHTFGVSADWLVTDNVGIFGRYTYATTDIDPVTPGRSGGSVDAQALQAGVAFLDLGKEGARLTLSYLIPFSVLDGRRFLASGGGDGGVQYELEATYYLPLTDNIALVPAVYFIGNPNNFSDNPDIWVGNLRTQFRF
jgi:hypothetical protein